jgi:hypothetical protein
MAALVFLDVAPDPVGLGVVALVILLVIGFVIFIASGLVVFLWYRKRSMRHLEIGPRSKHPQ